MVAMAMLLGFFCLMMCLLPIAEGAIHFIKCPKNQTVHDGGSLTVVAKAAGVPQDSMTYTVQVFGPTPDQQKPHLYSFYENGGIGGDNGSYSDFPDVFNVTEERAKPGELDIILTVTNISHWANGTFRFLIHLSPPPQNHLGERCEFNLTVTKGRHSPTSFDVITHTTSLRGAHKGTNPSPAPSRPLHEGTVVGIVVAVLGLGVTATFKLVVVAITIISPRKRSEEEDVAPDKIHIEDVKHHVTKENKGQPKSTEIPCCNE
ncbi:uncharacterized protein LOC144921332 [Branchiostoma floridae x Branchiostoma belcheri]